MDRSTATVSNVGRDLLLSASASSLEVRAAALAAAVPSARQPVQQTAPLVMSATPDEVEPVIASEDANPVVPKEEAAAEPAAEECGPGATYYTPMHPEGIKDTSGDFQVPAPCPPPRPPLSTFLPETSPKPAPTL
eukprot:SAG31_NODE_23069_length_512_cov_0.690073_1_plen_134_part_01